MTGIFTKYLVRRLVPSSRGIDHTECRYFVLDATHDPHSGPALFAYAESVSTEHPELAADLRRLAATSPGGAGSLAVAADDPSFGSPEAPSERDTDDHNGLR